MQEAVQASSSDQVVHEEWSGLNFQKTEQPMLMHSNVFDDTVRQLAAWNESSLQSASFSTSRLPSQTYDTGGDPNLNTVPNFQHNFKSSHGNNNGVPAKVPIVSFQLSTEDKIQFLQNQEQKQYLESGLQLQMPVTNRIWTEHTYDPTENNSADAQFKSQNIAGVWNQQENIYFSTANRQHSYGPNGSSTGFLVVPDGDGTSLIHGTDDNVWKLGAGHRIANGAKELQPRDSIHASNVSFDVIAAQSFENRRISQFSQNMFELLHKVDQSRDDNEIITPVVPAQAAAVVTASRPHFSQPSTLHGFGLHFSTPSQSVPLPNFDVSPQTSINYRQPLGEEAGDQDQLLSTPTVGSLPHESYQVENWINTSNVSGQEHKGTSGLDQKKMLPVIPSDFPYVGDQLQGKHEQCPPGIKYLLEQQQDKLVMNSGGHEALDETISNYLGNQANASILVRNSMLLREPPVAHNGDAADQSVQTSLPILVGRVPPSLAVPTSDTHESAYPQEMTHTKATGAMYSLVKSSGQHSPVVETRSGSLSNISGMPQQAGFSKMLHHVWANLSAPQRLAGLQPHRVASNILQSIINHGRDASTWGLQMADSRGNKEENAPSEVGSSFINSQDRDHQTIGNSFKPKHAENADGALSATTPQGLEPISSFFCRDSNVSIPSLVQHHQDIDKEKSGESSGFHPQVVHSPVTNTAPCRGDVCFSAHISVPSDSQQQNYSLLHQVQAIKDADSDLSMTLGKRLKGAGISSNASNMEQSAGQIFVHRQNELFRVPADGKQSSFPSDVKTLSFALKDNKRHTQISSVAEHHDLHDHMHSPDTSSSASLISGNEHYRSSPQMTLSLFENITELAWAQAVNRLIEKVADEAESIEDGPSNFQPRRRLILTTQMIQQLLPAVPPAIINVEATSAYERSTYYVAKSTLADACSQISSFERDSCADVNLTINKVKSFELRDHIFSKIVEEFNGRSKKLESEFSRLYKKGSTLDVRLECQELERFSIVNRLVKFHGRSQTNGVGGSSASEAAPRRTLPQRYVTAHSKPENFPDAALCISL
ncbi:hypothetical protein C4D60_Mb05t08990 [Musa balbisiana]|uniref:Uncharacterized protein n=1 Tax=Musa balbisiana TaxID=52838 RepID=A0A4S8JUT1_MUSBA|nr:hypothetical protein C4D60_Mb05t08990 [Musa balbisiana]